MSRKILIFIPTYNESGNVQPMCAELLALPVEADILFLDDNSADGTGALLDGLAAGNPRVRVIHRPGKLGIGSAHQAGIALAYKENYNALVTLDCDFTHTPGYIPELLTLSSDYAVVVGSRFLQSNSLPGWNLWRVFLTTLGHFLTHRLLKVPYDATTAFRVYDLDRIPLHLFQLVQSNGYSFFFESMFILIRNGTPVAEIPIVLPTRTQGSSKMSLGEIFKSLRMLISIYFTSVTNPERFTYSNQKPSS